jgi:DDE family transposase
MPTECSAERFDFGVVEGRAVEAAFDAGLVASDAGALLLGATDRAIDLVGRFADCFCDHRRHIDASAGRIAEVERIVRQIRARRPFTRIVLRAEGFAREALMAWCEQNRVDYLFGLARNTRLVAMIADELAAARAAAEKTGRPARRFKDFQWSTLDTLSRRRRVVAKAEWTKGEANPRFVVNSLKRAEAGARQLYEDIYCARGDMENRIKKCQLDLFADRTSAATMRANQLRLWFASTAFVLICALRRIGLAETTFADRHLRHHPPQAPEDRRAGAHQRPPHQDRHGLGLSSRPGLGTRGWPPGLSRQGSRLAGLTRHAAARPIGGITNKAKRRHSKPNRQPRLQRHDSSSPSPDPPIPVAEQLVVREIGLAQQHLRTGVSKLSSRMGSSVPSRSCPARTPRGAWPVRSRWHWR